MESRPNCKGRCKEYRATRPADGRGRYISGQVRCQICEIYITRAGAKEDNTCRCCGYRVRTRPRNRVYKAKYRAELQSKK